MKAILYLSALLLAVLASTVMTANAINMPDMNSSEMLKFVTADDTHPGWSDLIAVWFDTAEDRWMLITGTINPEGVVKLGNAMVTNSTGWIMIGPESTLQQGSILPA